MRFATALVLVLSLCLPFTAGATEVWTGSSILFEKLDFADWNLPTNQDRITPSVWITRHNEGPIYNMLIDPGGAVFCGVPVPSDTEWAFGDIADFETLTYDSFRGPGFADCQPRSIVDRPAVLHLISEDIYIPITFVSWSCCNRGGVSYLRGTPPPIATDATSWSMLKALYE